MKKKKIRFLGVFLTIAMLLALFSTGAFAAGSASTLGNILANPGFENGLDGWVNGPGVTLDGGIRHTGNNSAKLEIASETAETAPAIGMNYIYALQGNTYTFSFWYKTVAGGQDGTLKIVLPASSEAVSLPVSGTNDWKLYQKTYEADKNVATAALGFSLTKFVGSIYIDDVSLVKEEKGLSLQNSSFENGLENWDVMNPDGLQIASTSVQAEAGSSSLLIGGKQTSFNSYVNQSLAVSGSGYYTLSGSAMAAYSFSGNGVVMKLEAVNKAGQVIASAQAQSGTGIVNDWGAFDCKLLVPDGTVNLNVKIGSLNSDCVFFVDNIQLNRIGDVPPDNLLANNSFESDLAGWDSYGSPYAFSTTSQFHSGTKSVSMAYFANEALNKHIAQTYDVVIQGNVKFSVWVKTDANLTGAGAALFIDAVDANGSVLKTVTSQTVSNTNGAWQQVSVSMDMPAGTEKVTAKIGGIYCTGAFYVDDAELTYVN